MTGLSSGVQYWVWRLVSATMWRLPPGFGYAAATAIGTAGFYLWPGGRRAMLANYRQVLPGASRDEVRRVARRSLVNYCKYLVDFVRFPHLDARAISALVADDGEFANLDRALADGKGAVIVCMHFGNWDMGAGAAAARGYPLTVVAETFADRRLDGMVVGARERLGMRIVKMERAGPSLFRALKAGGLVALLIDHPMDADGVGVRFFGGEVEVPSGAARLALRTGAKVVPTAFVRERSGEPGVRTWCDFGIELPHTGDRERDIRELTQAVVASHETFIRSHPDQWYMFRRMFASMQRTGAA